MELKFSYFTFLNRKNGGVPSAFARLFSPQNRIETTFNLNGDSIFRLGKNTIRRILLRKLLTEMKEEMVMIPNNTEEESYLSRIINNDGILEDELGIPLSNHRKVIPYDELRGLKYKCMISGKFGKIKSVRSSGNEKKILFKDAAGNTGFVDRLDSMVIIP